jgi:hypothetical protein
MRIPFHVQFTKVFFYRKSHHKVSGLQCEVDDIRRGVAEVPVLQQKMETYWIGKCKLTDIHFTSVELLIATVRMVY